MHRFGVCQTSSLAVDSQGLKHREIVHPGYKLRMGRRIPWCCLAGAEIELPSLIGKRPLVCLGPCIPEFRQLPVDKYRGYCNDG